MSRFTIAYEKVTLEQIASEESEFEWHYDFGDSWSHRVYVESVGEPEQARPPVCLDGARASPERARPRTVVVSTGTRS